MLLLDVPFAPGRPKVVESDGTNASLRWEPPVASGSGGPVAGYHVEYKVVGASDWISATNYLVRDTKYTGKNVRRSLFTNSWLRIVSYFHLLRLVDGLRPNGEYEFRIFAKNADGLSPPSQSSGAVRIRPLVPTRSPNYVNASFVGSYYDGKKNIYSRFNDIDIKYIYLLLSF